MKQIERYAGDDMIRYAKQVLDESGNVIGFEEYRPVYDENGKKIGEEKIDEEAEKKKREEEAAEVEEDFEIECKPVGLSESDLAAGKKAEEEQRKEFSRKVAEICKNPDHDEGQKRAELDKLLAANTTTATTITYA